MCHIVIVDRFLHRDMRIFLRAAKTRMAQGLPEFTDFHPVLHEVSRERVSQAVRSHFGVDASEL